MYYIYRYCEKWKVLNEFNVKRLCVGLGFCEWVLISGREFKQGFRLKWNYLSIVYQGFGLLYVYSGRDVFVGGQ